MPEAGGNGQGAPDLADVFRTVPEVATLLRMHEKSVYRMISAGRLPAIRLGKVLVPSQAVYALIESGRVPVRAWAQRRKTSHGQG